MNIQLCWKVCFFFKGETSRRVQQANRFSFHPVGRRYSKIQGRRRKARGMNPLLIKFKYTLYFMIHFCEAQQATVFFRFELVYCVCFIFYQEWLVLDQFLDFRIPISTCFRPKSLRYDEMICTTLLIISFFSGDRETTPKDTATTKSCSEPTFEIFENVARPIPKRNQ